MQHKPINKYTIPTQIEEKRSQALPIVLACWICGIAMAAYFYPQIQTYIQVSDVVEETPFTSKSIQSSQAKKSPTLPNQKANPKRKENAASLPILPQTIPQRILLIGSSSMNSDLGAFLAQSLRRQKLEVYRQAKVGSGLARPDFYNWMEELPKLIEEHHPELIIAQFIGNDCQSLVEADGSVLAKYGSAEWEEAYEKRISDFIDIAHNQGIRIVFLGMSNVRSSLFRRNLLQSNSIIEKTALSNNARFVSLWESTSDAEGIALEYISTDDISRAMYQEDGIHLSREGARMVAREVFMLLNRLYDWEHP